jgi:L-fuculose-phosphate aldolase
MPERLRALPGSPGCEDDAREALLATARATPSGPASLSLRWRRSGADGFLITPDRQPGRLAGPDDVSWMAVLSESPPEEGAASGRAWRPPAQWRLHRDLYRRREGLGAVILSRPVYCTTLACNPRIQKEGIPAFHPDVAVAGGDSIACAASAPGDSPAALEHLAAALSGRSACLVASLGLLATGTNLQAAADLAAEIETLAQIYWQVLMTGKAPS